MSLLADITDLRIMQWQYVNASDEARKVLGPRMDLLARRIEETEFGMDPVRFRELRRMMVKR